MDLVIYLLQGAIVNAVACVPFMLVILLMYIFRVPHKCILGCLALNLLVNIFFWVRCWDIELFLRQLVPYVSSFVWVWGDLYCKTHGKKDPEEETDVRP